MIIISDTTPIHYLILIEKEKILPECFHEIAYPGGVLQLPTTRRLPSLSNGMKESVRQISEILQNGGWFD